MKVLGLSPLDKDSTVTLMEDGKVLFAAGEERFTRVKLQNGFPWQALQGALRRDRHHAPRTSTSSAIRSSAGRRRRGCSSRTSRTSGSSSTTPPTGPTSDLIRDAAARVPNRETPIPGPAQPEREDGEGLRQDARLPRAGERRRRLAQHRQARLGGVGPRRRARSIASGTRSSSRRSRSCSSARKLKRVEHHLSHAANAYYTSGFDEALIVTLDGYGSGLAGSVSIGRDGAIERRSRRRVSALARHLLRVGHVRARLPAEPPRRKDRRPGGVRRSGGAARRAAVPIPSGAGQLPDSREQQRLLLADAVEPVPEDRRRGRVSARARGGRHDLRLALPAADRHQPPRAVGRRRRQRQAESAAQGDLPASRASSSTPTWVTAAAAPAPRCSSSTARALPHSAITDVYWGPSFSDEQIVDALGRAQLPFDHYAPIEPKIAAAHRRRQGRGALQRPHGIRPARAGQPLDPLSRQGARGEPVAQPAARPHRVHAVRAGDARRAP